LFKLLIPGSVDFSEISLLNGEILKIYQPTFLRIFVITIPITDIEEKVVFFNSFRSSKSRFGKCEKYDSKFQKINVIFLTIV